MTEKSTFDMLIERIKKSSTESLIKLITLASMEVAERFADDKVELIDKK